MKKVLSIALSLLIVLGTLSIPATATTEASGTWGDLTWTLDDNGTLTISGEGPMDDFEFNGEAAWRDFDVLSKIKAIIIEDGVTSIGDWAFKYCKMEKIVIGKDVASIGNGSFELNKFNKAILYISVAEENPAYQSKGNCLIETASKTLLLGCNNSVIPDDGSVTTIDSYALAFCDSFTEMNIPNGVTTIKDNAFSRCASLASISISNSITYIGMYAFSDCVSLTSVSIPSSVTFIGPLPFSGCTSLNSITVASDNTAYKSTGNCLIEIESGALLQACNGSVIPIDGSVRSICNFVFSGYTLDEIAIPEGIMDIQSGTFSNSTINRLYIPKSVTYIGFGAFSSATINEIFYAGTSAEWNRITIDENFNEPITEANIIFNTTPPVASIGDLNGDETVDNTDAAFVLKYDAGLTDLTAEQLAVADVNSDGVADNTDASVILKYDAGLIPSL